MQMGEIVESLSEANTWYWFDNKGREIKLTWEENNRSQWVLRSTYKLNSKEREFALSILMPKETTSVLINLAGNQNIPKDLSLQERVGQPISISEGLTKVFQRVPQMIK